MMDISRPQVDPCRQTCRGPGQNLPGREVSVQSKQTRQHRLNIIGPKLVNAMRWSANLIFFEVTGL
jgi:hypothetical protein